MTAHRDKPSNSDADATEGDRPSLSLKTKLKAWWEGYDLSGRKGRAAAAQADANTSGKQQDTSQQPGLNRFGKPLWSASRLDVAEKIWGPGFTLPGGEELISTLVKPLGLNPAMTVLELGCGLGGATRCMASQFGCWVTGLEASPFLVEQGMERSLKAGQSKQAPVQLYDPENLKYAKRVDAVFAKDVFYTIKDKSTLFDRIEALLKPRGQLLFTDYIITPEARNSPALRAWADREPLEPNLWTLQGALDAFAQCNLDLRVNEDITEAHRNHIVMAIRALMEHLEKHHMDKDTKINVIDEVETWAQRVTALHSGLRCYRFYGLKPPES